MVSQTMALFNIIVFCELSKPLLQLVRINHTAAIQSYGSIWPCLTHPIFIQIVGRQSLGEEGGQSTAISTTSKMAYKL